MHKAKIAAIVVSMVIVKLMFVLSVAIVVTGIIRVCRKETGFVMAWCGFIIAYASYFMFLELDKNKTVTQALKEWERED